MQKSERTQGPSTGAGPRDPALLAPLPVEVSLMEEDGRYVMYDDNGRLLYFHDRDPLGESTCYDECADNWEPMAAEGGADRVVGDWSVLVREDGSHQWLYQGQPVYVPRGDGASARSGDAGEHWHVLSP